MPIIEADSFNLVLDPTEVSGDRTQVFLQNADMHIQQAGIDWGDAAIQEFLADMERGSAPVDYRIPNRTITIPLMIAPTNPSDFDTIRETLQQKVALIQAEGGWLKRGDVGVYAILVGATLTKPDYIGEVAGMEPNVKLVLEALPDFYGDEVTLDISATAHGVYHGVLKQSSAQAAIGGDYPGQCRIVVTDTSGVNQLGALWAFRSRHYDSATTAALYYEAEALTPTGGAAVTTKTWASGGASNNVVEHSNLPGGSWASVLLTTLAGTGELTHQGSYQVWVRGTSPQIPQIRLAWGTGDLSHPIINDSIRVPSETGASDAWLVSLGQIRVDPSAVGDTQWVGVIQACADNQGDQLYLDHIMLQPLDEFSGQLAVSTDSTPILAASFTDAPTVAGNDSAVGTQTWTNPSNAFSDDALYAIGPNPIPSNPVTTEYLKLTGFNFNIPSGATVQGIAVNVKRHKYGNVADYRVRLVKAGTVQTQDRAGINWANGFDNTVTYGGPTDVWDTYTPSDVNNAGFGFAIAANVGLATPSTGGAAYINSVTMTVYYTVSGSLTTYQDVVIPASGIAQFRTEGWFRQLVAASSIYSTIDQVIGDIPRIPPSFAEGRAVEVFVRPTRSDFDLIPDDGAGTTTPDTFTVQVYYRPSYLFPQ